jgi:hypothetical protein
MALPDDRAFDLPGFRRRTRVEPVPGAVLAMVEDDIHCMAVVLRHDGDKVVSVEPVTERMPWDTCPGATARLIETFSSLPLDQVTARRDKKQNCTHLHDLAVLAASHAGDASGIVFDIAASDPVGGQRILEIRRNGSLLHRWIEQDGTLVSPDEIVGQTLLTMREWIGSLEGDAQEAARLLQWGSLVAHGRTMPIEDQSLASALPPNCYTFQPERAAQAKRVGDRFDFSEGTRVPLGGFGDTMLAALDEQSR